MSREKDYSRKYRILEEMKKVYPVPDLDKILPPDLDKIEDKLTEQEFDNFVTKAFNKFYSKFVDSRSKTFFVCLPLEFFTKENVIRVKEYANIAFYIKVENCSGGKDGMNLAGSKKFYEDLHSKFLKILFDKLHEYEAKKKEEQNKIF